MERTWKATALKRHPARRITATHSPVLRSVSALDYRGTSLIRNCQPYDNTVGLCLGPYVGPRGLPARRMTATHSPVLSGRGSKRRCWTQIGGVGTHYLPRPAGCGKCSHWVRLLSATEVPRS